MRGISYFLLFCILIFFCASPVPAKEQTNYVHLRERMVKRQIIARGVIDPQVIRAMEKVPRHLFVPKRSRDLSYGDYPLRIGEGQTISQPYIVAFMTEALDLRPEDRVLEIGTGSGYQAAVLAELVKEVYTIEIIENLGKRARQTLDLLGYENVYTKTGDGHRGWPDKAPFDAVIVTCAPEDIPQPLVYQLKEGGRMIIPVGKAGAIQKLVRAKKKLGRLKKENVMRVRFVPMVRGEHLE